MPLTSHLNAFAGNPLDRASDRRHDEAWLAAALDSPTTTAIALWNGEILVHGRDGSERLTRLPIDYAREVAPSDEALLFLGMDCETAIFAIDVEGSADPTAGPLAGHGGFFNLRELASRLGPPEAAMAATAKGVFEWRRRHRFCPNCGASTRPVEAGWKRICDTCGTEHFPRTDPVVIMLPVCGERCLLGHNTRFPPGRFSTLAGFVEPGETPEEACARELGEEAGLKTLSVVYHSAQPWPFPSSLMIGLIAEVAEGEALADQSELDEVRWFTRAEARALLDGQIEGIAAPPPFAIAHQLIKAWAYGG